MISRLLVLSWVVVAGPRGAPELRPEPPPLEVEVDGTLEVDLASKTGRGRGNIRLRRGAVAVCCGSIDLRYGEDGIREASCRERVVVVWGEKAWGTAGAVVVRDDRLALDEGVSLWSDEGHLTAARVELDPEGGRLRLRGHPARWTRSHSPPSPPRACPKP